MTFPCCYIDAPCLDHGGRPYFAPPEPEADPDVAWAGPGFTTPYIEQEPEAQ